VDGPEGSQHYTFTALVATQESAAAVRAVVAAQRALKREPSLARRAAQKLFPSAELALIDELVRRDAPYYEPLISQASVRALNDFAKDMGLLSRAPTYDEVVATHFKP